MRGEALVIPSTYSFVEASVLLLGVGTVTVHVNVGEASGAFSARASKTAFCEGAIVVVPLLIASATFQSA